MKMAAEVEKVRPIIRVEIKNNLVNESMDVDGRSEEEEGEINDDNDNDDAHVEIEPPVQQRTVFNRVWPHLNTKDTFTTGINIFDREEQQKRLERAKRFALKPDEIRYFTNDDLKLLHESLGITAENKHDVRFEAIHMLYTDNMTSEDVLDYFNKYAPTGIEWIDEKSCNVIWVDNISAARALHSVSKVIRGMPVRAPCDPFAKDFLDGSENNKENNDDDDAGRSVLLRNSNREIELIGEPKSREVELKEDDEDIHSRVNMTNSVDVSDITAPIPPGYWRLGEGHQKSKCILLRFAFITDKQPYKMESFAKYYKKIGSTKVAPVDPRRARNRSIFERNRELQHTTDKNPWGVLAKNWDEDAKFRERDRQDMNRIEIKNPSIRRRLGLKRKLESESGSDVEIVENENKAKKTVKLPRMRMYADDEEEKIKRKKLLQTLKLQADKISKQTVESSDLRSILALSNRQNAVDETVEDEEEIDLTYDLTNPNRRMIFTVQRAIDENKSHRHSTRSHDRRPTNSSSHSQHKSSERRRHKYGSMVADREDAREQDRKKQRSERDKFRSDRVLEKSKYHKSKLHSDRERREKHRPKNEEDYSEEYSGKPKSKVAVVIKTQKQPTVASKVWSRVGHRSKSHSEEEESESESETESESESGSESESESSESSSSSSSSSHSEEDEEESSEDESRRRKSIARPGFERSVAEKIVLKSERRSPLKIEISNDHYKRK